MSTVSEVASPAVVILGASSRERRGRAVVASLPLSYGTALLGSYVKSWLRRQIKSIKLVRTKTCQVTGQVHARHQDPSHPVLRGRAALPSSACSNNSCREGSPQGSPHSCPHVVQTYVASYGYGISSNVYKLSSHLVDFKRRTQAKDIIVCAESRCLISSKAHLVASYRICFDLCTLNFLPAPCRCQTTLSQALVQNSQELLCQSHQTTNFHPHKER